MTVMNFLKSEELLPHILGEIFKHRPEIVVIEYANPSKMRGIINTSDYISMDMLL